MQEKGQPNWLTFEAGQEVIVKLVCDQSVHQVNHWISNKPEYCRGEGCKYCQANIPTRERDLVDVEADGERYVMTLPASAYERMIDECVQPFTMRDRVIRIMPSGPSNSRTYLFELVDSPEPGEALLPWSFADKVKLFADTLRAMADDLEGIFLAKE